MSYALLSRISSANYKPSVSHLPHTVTSVLAFWCVAILIQVEGPSPSSLQPIDPQEVFKPSLMQFYPETCQCWLMRAVRPQCGQGGEAEQPFALCALWNAPSAQPAQEKSRGHSCPALLTAHSHLHRPWGNAHAAEQSQSVRRCLPAPPACMTRPYPVKEEAFGLTGVSKAWDHSCWFTT